MSDIKGLYKKLKDYVEETQPEALKALHPPAIDKDIQPLKKRMTGVNVLPKEYVEFLKIHNGASPAFNIAGWEPLPVARSIKTWNLLNGMVGHDFKDNKPRAGHGVANDWWNPNWMPIFETAWGDNLCIDFAPASGGKIGQIIEFVHDDGDRRVKYSSFGECFDALVHLHMKEMDEYLARKKKQEEDEKNKKSSPSWIEWIKSKF